MMTVVGLPQEKGEWIPEMDKNADAFKKYKKDRKQLGNLFSATPPPSSSRLMIGLFLLLFLLFFFFILLFLLLLLFSLPSVLYSFGGDFLLLQRLRRRGWTRKERAMNSRRVIPRGLRRAYRMEADRGSSIRREAVRRRRRRRSRTSRRPARPSLICSDFASSSELLLRCKLS